MKRLPIISKEEELENQLEELQSYIHILEQDLYRARKNKRMNMKFSIPIKYIRKYALNETTSKEIQEFVFDMISDWKSEDYDVYQHYADLEAISARVHGGL